MTFGEKVRRERKKLNLTQEELAETIGVTRRVITSYESDKSRPRGTNGYKKLADALGVNVNYLLTEDEAFVLEARDKYGSRGAKEAKELLTGEICALFAGGELPDEELDGIMRAMQEAYWKAKENNRKYAPKKYRKPEEKE